MKVLKISFVIAIFTCCSISFSGQSQAQEMTELTYISPVPGSKYIMPGNNIALRHGDPFDVSSVKNTLLHVTDSRNKGIGGKLVLSDDDKTLLFYPDSPFELGDKINVKLNRGLYTKKGAEVNPVEFTFFISENVLELDQQFLETHIYRREADLIKPQPLPSSPTRSTNNPELPEGYPAYSVLVDNDPPEGYYFYTLSDDWNAFPDNDVFITIADKHGTPVYYRKLENSGYDLKIQHNGLLSFYTYHPFWKHQVMDSAFQIVGSYGMGNGYGYTDFHDFQIYENGHYFVLTYDAQIVDMSQLVPDGNPEATVIGFVMQELDSVDNVIFQWRSWDHYEITETGPEIDLTAESIDYVHGNTIEVESDTSILISSRNFHEITKIHRNTGDIIWRLGGSQNQFEFINDTLMINRQHDCRRLPNGEVSIFDNGTKRPEPFSSVPVYDINPEDSTATLTSRYRHNPDILGLAMGNAQWTVDTTLVVGWGTGIPGITEVDYEDNILYELQYDAMSYRAYRFPWSTTYFTTENKEVDFGFIWQEDQVTKTVMVRNNQPDTIEITGYHVYSDKYTIDHDFPIIITAEEEVAVNITFIPGETGTFTDVLTLNSDINTDELVQRIALQIELTGLATEGQGVGGTKNLHILASPNPVKDQLRLTFDKIQDEINIRVSNVQGKNLLNEKYSNCESCVIDMSRFKKGLYFIEAFDEKNELSGAIKIVKE